MSLEKKKHAHIQADIFGVKVDATPSPDSESPPQTWREVAGRVNRSLMNFVTRVLELPEVVLEVAHSIVRGVGRLPPKRERQINLAHDRADKTLAHDQGEKPTEAEAWDELEMVIVKLNAKGVQVFVQELSTGEVTAIAVRPELAESGADAAKQAIARQDGSAEIDIDKRKRKTLAQQRSMKMRLMFKRREREKAMREFLSKKTAAESAKDSDADAIEMAADALKGTVEGEAEKREKKTRKRKPTVE